MISPEPTLFHSGTFFAGWAVEIDVHLVRRMRTFFFFCMGIISAKGKKDYAGFAVAWNAGRKTAASHIFF